jgi:NADH-quinone oxidoreductase subunit M
MTPHLITLMLLLPFAGALLQAPARLPSRWIALGASLAGSLCGVFLVASMRGQTPELQDKELIPWIGSYAISYDMGVDGLNALLVLLVSIVFPLLIAAEWKQRPGNRGMHGLLLILQASLAGAVCAQDLFLLFFFWALSALPFYFLIGIWGGEKRESAAFRSIVAASIGNALLFAALILVYYSVDPHTFSLQELAGGKLAGKTFRFLGNELAVSSVAFGLIGAGLALRAPVWPFHGWFTHVAEEAPPSVFVAQAAVSVPVAAYVFVRLAYSLFPETVVQWADAIVVVGALNLVMGGLCATAQRGLNLLLAFLCLGEVGLILMGIGSLNSAGVVGALFQVLSLGLGVAGFGLFSGLMADRTGRTRFLADDGSAGFGGVAAQAPAMAVVAGVVIASLLGFPGLGGFVGHSLLMIGSYSIHPAAVVLAGAALLLATYYLFTMYRHVFLGKVAAGIEGFSDLTAREQAYLLPLVGCLFVFGLYPKPLIELVRPTVLMLLSTIR